MSSNPKEKRNYRKEYDNYQGKPEQIANRGARNKARAEYEKANGNLPSKVDVDHKTPMKNGGANTKDNLRAVSESKNSSWRKGSTGYKVKKV
jgi:hypothetical protein